MKKAIFLFFAFIVSTASAQQASTGTNSTYPPVVNFSAQEDHQHMMEKLGIKALSPGPSGDEKASSHANYDEALFMIIYSVQGGSTHKFCRIAYLSGERSKG